MIALPVASIARLDPKDKCYKSSHKKKSKDLAKRKFDKP